MIGCKVNHLKVQSSFMLECLWRHFCDENLSAIPSVSISIRQLHYCITSIIHLFIYIPTSTTRVMFLLYKSSLLLSSWLHLNFPRRVLNNYTTTTTTTTKMFLVYWLAFVIYSILLDYMRSHTPNYGHGIVCCSEFQCATTYGSPITYDNVNLEKK